MNTTSSKNTLSVLRALQSRNENIIKYSSQYIIDLIDDGVDFSRNYRSKNVLLVFFRSYRSSEWFDAIMRLADVVPMNKEMKEEIITIINKNQFDSKWTVDFLEKINSF